ncbi:MAG: ATP-binding cassette domain-containing protein [Bdellovibrionales bacterium]|nr:ATP-binding cassette domain-containing protein [Bdellovibrionales bacterium]
MGSKDIVLTAKGVHQSFNGADVLCGVDLTLHDKEIVGLIGPSGSGKSVLLKTLSRVIPPTSGEISTFLSDGEEVSFMFQEGALFDSVSVLDNVAFPLVGGRVPCSSLSFRVRKTVCKKVGAILDKVGLSSHSHKFPAQLSGGMRRRVSLARALVNEPEIALLDDPTSGLDPVASSVIMKLIEELHSTFNTSMILVSHDLRRLIPVCSRIIALFDGKVVFDGTVEELRSTAPDYVQQFVRCRYDLQDVA